jgi:hypothetical protein
LRVSGAFSMRRCFARTQLEDMLGAAGVDGSRFDVRIEEHPPLRVVRRAMRRGVPSLLILGTSAPNALARIISGSLVNDALLRLECDVLICPRSVDIRTATREFPLCRGFRTMRPKNDAAAFADQDRTMPPRGLPRDGLSRKPEGAAC